MKKVVRVLLVLACVVYLALFAKDLESLLDYERLSLAKNDAKTWFWLYYSELLPLVALVFASVYAFSKYLWKKRWMLTVAVALCGIFLAFSDYFHIYEEYNALHPAVTLLATGIYIACIYAAKVPYRRYIAGGTMAVLMVSLWIVCGMGAGFDAVLSWSLGYTAPLIPLGMLGLILPERYD